MLPPRSLSEAIVSRLLVYPLVTLSLRPDLVVFARVSGPPWYETPPD